ncbi:MAG TPA: PilZ domain-containing protein [Candidatus Angelobacter sp.]|nr:PilZ domain-containing protein [Candidatus Angelobacter sp.]
MPDLKAQEGVFPLQPNSTSDARRWNRHKIDIRLKITAPSSSGGTSAVFGRGNSMSRGGIGAYIPCSLAIGATVDLDLTFPYSSNEVKVKAIVRSCEGFRYGLEFVEVPEDVRTTIMNSCNAADAAQAV